MRLVRFAWQHSALLVSFAMVTSIAAGLANASLVVLISRQFTQESLISNQFVAILGGFVILTVSLDLVAKHLLNILTSEVRHKLSTSLTSQIFSMPFAQLEEIGVARLTTLLIDDVRTVGQVINTLPALSLAVSTVLGCIVYLAWLSPIALFVVLTSALPIAIAYSLLHRTALRLWGKALNERNRLYAHYRSLIYGIKELTLHARRQQRFRDELLQPAMQAYKEQRRSAYQQINLAQSVNQFTFFVVLVLLLAASRTFSLPIEVIAAYALIVLYLKSTTMTIVSALPQWTESKTTIDQMEALGFLVRISEQPVALIPLATTGTAGATVELKLNQLVYKYTGDGGAFQVGPIELRLGSRSQPLDTGVLPSEGIVFIIGGNGSGKTTLMKCLVGLYEAHSGHIEWNGVRVDRQNLEAYRQNFSVVFAEPYLFTQLLPDNQDDLDERINAHLHQLQLEEKVSVQGGRLSTVDLSYGQRKRLALLAAILEDRPVVVFDEWAAGQDPHFKELFYRRLLPELRAKGKMVLVISHDEHYYDVADRIVKLEYGRIEYDQRLRPAI